jgi:putative endonuclease
MTAGWVYVMTNRPNGTLYVGVTSDLPRRIWEHREGVVDGFTRRYKLKRLVFAERHHEIAAAIQRERNMKH